MRVSAFYGRERPEGERVGFQPGLGWPTDGEGSAPESTESREATGLGWPAEPGEEHLAAEAEDDADDDVSRETARAGSVGAPVTVSRETTPVTRRQTRIITISNQKGGVGKTTTVVNLAAALAQLGHRALVLDMDPQGNASTALGVERREQPSIYDVLLDDVPLSECIREVALVPGLTCVPSTIDLAGAEVELVTVMRREQRLEDAVQRYLADCPVELRPEFVLVDCPPSLGLLTLSALVAAREVLVPIQCEYYALEGLGQLLGTIERVRDALNPGLHVSTILLTMFDARTRLSAQVAEEVRAHLGTLVLPGAVPRSVRVSEAPSHAQTVMTYDPTSRGALAYRSAAESIISQHLPSTVEDADHLELVS